MKKIKFPLEMAGGRRVKELDEFQEFFDLEKALVYFVNGKLQKWLENTYNDDILAELGKLTGKEPDFLERFMDVLGVECEIDTTADAPSLLRIAQLKEKLRAFFQEESVEEMACRTAETQEDLERLMEEGKKKIYLLAGSFQIPKRAEKIEFEGLDGAKVMIEETDSERFKSRKLQFLNILPGDERSREYLEDQTDFAGAAGDLFRVMERLLDGRR